MSDQPRVAAGWYADPEGRHEYRWWDGERWGDLVADGGQTQVAPLGTHPPSGRPETGTGTSRSHLIAGVVVAAVLVVGAGIAIVSLGGDDGDDADQPDRDGSTSAASTATATIGTAGGRVEIPADDEVAGGVAIELPAGAVDADTEISVDGASPEVGPMSDLLASDGSIWWALADTALDDPEPIAHPVYGPLLVAFGTELTGPALEFGPDGLVFAEPATVTVPLGLLDLGADEVPLVLLEGPEGWEVVDSVEVDVDADVLRYPVSHFSRSFIGRIFSNAFSNPTATVSIDRYREALDTLSEGPIDDVESDVSRAILCRDGISFDPGAVPSMTDVLEYLGFESQRIGTAPAQAGTRIRDRLVAHFETARAAGDEAPHDVGFDQLLTWAMEETGNDPFQALVLTHDVLRDNRESEPVQAVLANVRGDGGDERGARYHLIGTAVYSFIYEHQRATENLAWWTPRPETAVSLEEAWVSGDITTDTVEYAVDRAGATMGRILYHDYVARRDGQTTGDLFLDCEGLDDDAETEPPESTTTSTVPPELELGTGDVQVTLLWAGDADMDLHVIDPLGEEIYYSSPASTSGGQLDHDDIPACGSETGSHAENIFWPTGNAPEGEYTAFVHLFSSCDGDAASAQLSVQLDSQAVDTRAFTLADDEESDRITFTVG